jgi:predicted GNAT family acetyltransferase
MDEITVINNKDQLRFEVSLAGEDAYIEYRFYKKDIAFMHTFVPESFKGKGIASKMAITALDFARAQHKKIMLYCPFMSRYVKEHPQYYDLVDTEYHPSFIRPQ